MVHDYLVVGSGFYGSILAERIANDMNRTVLVIDKRNHIGGNCHSEIHEETGIEFHTYGTHIFHTSSSKVWEYINRFTEFNGYHHQVLTTYRDRVYQMPINLETVNSFYNLNLRPYEVENFLKKESEKESIIKPKNFEEKAISKIGRPLYEAFIKGYTAKQWGKNPKELPASIFLRLPIRNNYCEDYFVNCRWQGIPLDGFTKIFKRMLESPNIKVELNCDYFANRESFKFNRGLIYTGAIDKFFDYEFGPLEWRSIELVQKTKNVKDYQGISVMNYAEQRIPFTRIHEPLHLHPERDYKNSKTLIFKEFSSKTKDDDPYYPIGNEVNKTVFQKYKELAEKDPKIIIGGRLGNYTYYDMDKVIEAALNCYEKKIAI